jgi:uncharacterized protein (DUF1800 family)
MNLRVLFQLIAGALIFSAGFAARAACTAKPVSTYAASRFLEQASWGPTADSVQHVAKVGFDCYFEEQFKAPLSPIPDATISADGKNSSPRPDQDAFFVNAVIGQDQLRQRMAFALGQIWVVSAVKLAGIPMPPYLRLLQQDAFTTYDVLMKDVTLSPAMGHYLDMVNNDKPNPTTGKGANENYAREIMQLFTIGLSQLNDDGTLQLDPSTNQPIPTYNQNTIEGFSRAFTGWTYAPLGTTSKFTNPPNWNAPMVPFNSHHDADPKMLLDGFSINNGNDAQKDLDQALSNIFTHKNVGPFVCRQLIQHLVTSAPSPAYVKRVVDVFNTAPRGNLQAVVKAILLDKEARKGDDGQTTDTEGHLREPVLFINALLRELGGITVDAANALADLGTRMGQTIYYPPTVFNYFPPDYQVNLQSGGTANAPEFDLLTESTAMTRADFLNTLAFGKIRGVTVDLTNYVKLASNGGPQTLLDSLDSGLMRGSMRMQVLKDASTGNTTNMYDTILQALQVATTPTSMVQQAIYLIGSSWQYQVER